MELIARATLNTRIVVPYSARRFQPSLSVAGFSGREFIAKAILQFSGSSSYFGRMAGSVKQYWKETVNEDAG